jgi:hypothetical protein
VVVGTGIIGSGFGLVFPPATAVIMDDLGIEKAGDGAAVNQVARQVGGASARQSSAACSPRSTPPKSQATAACPLRPRSQSRTPPTSQRACTAPPVSTSSTTPSPASTRQPVGDSRCAWRPCCSPPPAPPSRCQARPSAGHDPPRGWRERPLQTWSETKIILRIWIIAPAFSTIDFML